jgi:recombinational DNA repair ATPase RecF
MDEQKQNDFLEKVRIKGLWNRLDVKWDLHPDVNILVGENGTGKSTILSMIYGMSLFKPQFFQERMVSKILLGYSNKSIRLFDQKKYEIN